MWQWLQEVARLLKSRRSRPSRSSYRLGLEQLEDRAVPATAFLQTNLVSDIPGLAEITDPNLKNPWGVAVNPTGDFWVSDAATGKVTLYSGDVNGSPIAEDAPVITVPAAAKNAQGAPSGQVLNTTQSFAVNGTPALFLIAGLDSTISAVAPNPSTGSFPSKATLEVSNPGAIFTGLAIGSNASGNFLFAADAAKGTIDVFNTSFQKVKLSGSFTDPHLPANFVPFNVVNVNGTLYVTYENAKNHSSGGVVDRFDTNGKFLGRFASGANLNAPWAVVMAPANFGSYSNDLLIGNFGDGHISVYNPTTGAYLGQLTGLNGQPIAIGSLWQLTFGNGGSAGNADTLYFTSGLNAEKDGLFGSLTPLSLNQQLTPQQVNALLQQGATNQQVVQSMGNTSGLQNLAANNLYLQLLQQGVGSQGLNLSSMLAFEATAGQTATVNVILQALMQLNGGTVNGSFVDALGRPIAPVGQVGFTAPVQTNLTPAEMANNAFVNDLFRADDTIKPLMGFTNQPLASATTPTFLVDGTKVGTSGQQVIAQTQVSNAFFAALA
jgi:uncharacterized protein (TIGR03118 family)